MTEPRPSGLRVRWGRTSGPLAALLAAAALAGCGSDSDGDATLTVYVSAPLSGPRADDGQDVADGAQLALEDAGGEAGGVEVSVEVLDDATDEGWDAALTGANARAAVEDTTAIAYIGELDSGASRTSIPITNQAEILQVSPGAGAVDLTRENLGSDEIPELQSSGERTFARVIPDDTAQGEAAAVWMDGEGVSSVAITSDDSAFAESLVDGFESAPSRPEVVEEGGRAIYVAGEDADGTAVQAGEGERGLYLTDAQLEGRALGLVSRSTPIRFTSAAMDPSQLPPAGEEFVTAFESAYDREPGRFAAYGYEAMAATLAAVDDADDHTDRGDVVDAFFDIDDRDSILGTYSIDDVGDTTLAQLGDYSLAPSGKLKPGAEPITLP